MPLDRNGRSVRARFGVATARRTTRWPLVLGLLLMLVLAPAAGAADQSLKGTLRGPDGSGLADVTLTVTRDGQEVGTTVSGADGTWAVAVEPGLYEVRLDVASLPPGLEVRTAGGETLTGVEVRPAQDRTVIFPLVPQGQQVSGPSSQSPPAAGSPSPPAGATPGTSGSDAEGAMSSPPPLAGKSTFSQALQLLVESLKFGSIIAITAVGLSLVFGTTGLINFAHGELVTIGAVTAYFLSSGPGSLPLVFAALLAIVVVALIGGGMEVGLWKPLRARYTGLIQMFIVSIGVSLLLRHLILVVFGSRRLRYNAYTVQQTLSIGPVSIAPRDAVVVLLSIIVLVGLGLLLQRTRMGKAARAVADNRQLAEASGIDADRVVLAVWIVGGGLAGLGGVFFGLVQQAVFWDMGFNLLLLMFAGVILGGLGSAYGAVVGSFVVAMVAQLSTLWFPIDLQYAWALLALIVVLLVRPQGIFGRAQRAG